MIALLMQEQPFYANGPAPFQEAGKRAMQGLGGLGFGHGGDASVGRAQMKAPTAQRILEQAGYGTYDIDELRHRLTHDDEFAVALAVLHLKLDLENGMTDKQAYLAYSLSEGEAQRLMNPHDPLVQSSEVLSERSARYDANLEAIGQAGDMVEYFEIDDLSEPRYGCEGGICAHAGACPFEMVFAPLPLDGRRESPAG